MWDVILDALIDSAKLLPFLLIIYLLIEWFEQSKTAEQKAIKLLNGKCAPLLAGSIGLVPQCGFSVLATHLYLERYIKMGTLVALFVATSDEALPILLSDGKTFVTAWIVVGIKVVYAVLLGYLINAFDRRSVADTYTDCHAEGCCKHELNSEEEHKGFWAFVKHPLIHTAKIFVYILIINIVFGTLMYYFESDIAKFMEQTVYVQPLVVALVGLIPNCGSSVIITGMYTNGIITFGAMLAGLCANSGIALAVLLKDRQHWRSNLLIVALLYLSGVLIGTVFTIIAPDFWSIAE